MSNDTASQNPSNDDADLADLMRRADAGEALTDEDLARLAAHGRCPDCGRTPDADPGFAECESSGFHQGTVKEASDASQDDEDTTDGASDDLRTPADYARSYKTNRYAPIPLKSRSKIPRDPSYATLTYEPADFGMSDNIGLLLGPASNNLVDVDLDCLEAVGLAKSFLRPTDLIFGRQSKLNSHYLYLLDAGESLRRTIYQDPDGTLLLELRGEGQQTMAPPHPSTPTGKTSHGLPTGNPATPR